MPYPTPPGTRVAYDLDGSQALIRSGADRDWLDVHSNALRAMNSERGGGMFPPIGPEFPGDGGPRTIVLIFPQPMRIRGIFAQYNFSQAVGPTFLSHGSLRHRPEVALSPDSTNGEDGTFTSVIFPAVEPTAVAQTIYSAVNALTGEPYGGGTAANDGYRRIAAGADDVLGIVPVAGAATRNVRAIRLTLTLPPSAGGVDSVGPAMKLHVYGEPDTTAIGSRLDFWQADIDQRFSPEDSDWGDVPLTTTKDRSFRVRNRSTDETAVNVRVALEAAASSTTPAPSGFFLLSLDGVIWQGAILLASLSPGMLSPEIFIRMVVPSDAQLSNWSPRIIAEVEEWV